MSAKKISALTLTVGLIFISPISVFAKTSTNIINGVTVSTTCNLHSSSHYIYKSYASGSAKIFYTENGQLGSKNVLGSSQSNYWVASKTLPSTQNAYKATTTYSGQTVTASY